MSRTLSLSVLVPYRPDGGWRDRHWRNVVHPYLSALVEHWQADAELLVETPAPEGPGHPGDFNHPAAINAAADRSSGDLLMICDADCLPDPAYARLAERAVQAGAQWVRPRLYRKLSRRATEIGLPVGPVPDSAYEWIGDAVSWAGCPIYPRAAFFDVGGYDERISWWGADDVAMGMTMTTLYGESMLLEGVTHLWHPDPIEHNYGHERHRAQQALVDRYTAAAGDPHAIRRVRYGDD